MNHIYGVYPIELEYQNDIGIFKRRFKSLFPPEAAEWLGTVCHISCRCRNQGPGQTIHVINGMCLMKGAFSHLCHEHMLIWEPEDEKLGKQH